MTDHREQPEMKRLHIAGAFVKVAENLPVLFFFVVAWLLGGVDTDQGMEGLIYLALIPLFLAHGLVRWWRFRYWIADGEFRVLEGAIIRREVFIPFEKIRAVEVNEGLWQRLFGVVQLQVKTGATGTQANLSAVSRTEAEQLQEQLRTAARRARGEISADVERQASNESSSESDDFDARRVASFGELVAAGATSGRLGFVAAIAAWIFGETADATVEPMIEWVTNLPADDSTRLTLFIGVGIAVVFGLILSFLGSIVATFAKYGQFSVTRRDDDLVIRHGLLSRQTITLPLHRIQAIRFIQNPLRQALGAGSLVVEAIGHSEQKGQSSELYPLIGRDDLEDFLREFVPEFAGSVDIVRPPGRALVRFLFVPTLLAALPAMGLAYFVGGLAALALVLVPLVAGLRYLAWRQTGVGLSAELAHIESRGLLSLQTAIFPRRAVRSSGTKANVFQRRRDLATLDVTVASGAAGRVFQAPNLDETIADRAMGWRPGSGGAPARTPNRSRP